VIVVFPASFPLSSANAEIMREIRIRQFPDASVPYHYSPILPFDAIAPELLITSLNKA